MKENHFTTSYYNFISDHKSISLRIGLDNNKVSQKCLERITFDEERHLKAKQRNCSEKSSLTDSDTSSQSFEENSDNETVGSNVQNFRRRFLNKDASTCWLNSCLQLVLSAMDTLQDYDDFTSEL